MSDDSPLILLSIRSTAAAVELLFGQPLDRWKMNIQLPPKERMPVRKLIALGPKEWYTASTTSMVQRVFFYIPLIYFGNDYWNKNFGADSLAGNIAKASFLSSLVTPCVSWFENVKTRLQLNVNTGGHKSLWAITKRVQQTEGIRKLFPTIGSTFGREFFFSAGLCCVAPFFHNKLLQYTGYDSHFVAGALAGISSQVLSQPFDTIKSWQESHTCDLRTAVGQINKQGMSFYMRGTLPRALRGAWTLGCLTFVTQNLKKVVDRVLKS